MFNILYQYLNEKHALRNIQYDMWVITLFGMLF